MPIHGRNNELDIARYYSIPEHILATAFPSEYTEYKQADDALVQIVEARDADIGGARSCAIEPPKEHRWGEPYVSYILALHEGIDKLKRAMRDKGVPAEPLMNDNDIMWRMDARYLYGICLTPRGKRIMDALGCQPYELAEAEPSVSPWKMPVFHGL